MPAWTASRVPAHLGSDVSPDHEMLSRIAWWAVSGTTLEPDFTAQSWLPHTRASALYTRHSTFLSAMSSLHGVAAVLVTSMDSSGFEFTAKLFRAVAAETVRSSTAQKPLPGAAADVEGVVVDDVGVVGLGVVGLGVVVVTPMEPESRGWAEVAGAEFDGLVVVLDVVCELA